MIGSVSTTQNPQVALYTVNLYQTAQVSVQFGTTTSYGQTTWVKPTPAGGGQVSIFVAGMRASTQYHMRAQAVLANGRTVYDIDHTFTTSGYPTDLLPVFTTTTTAGQTPQPGIEILNPIGTPVQIAATDLSGNIIWAYYDSTINIGVSTWLAPKLLPNGDFIAVVAPSSTSVLTAPAPAGAANLIREFDLAGDTVKQITIAQLNASLVAAGYDLPLQLFSHDITVLPNGHWIVLANMFKSIVLNGQTTPTQVLGDVLVDLDTNLNPVWAWSEFDHLDVSRQPWMFPDWTHSNAVLYSPDDGNLVISIRHQNWILKINYDNGAGNGDVLWHLGAGGDFKLVGGTNPTDWNFAQHGPSFTTTNTSGQFGLAVLDNGDDRVYPGGNPNVGLTCGVNGAPACYSTAINFLIDETAMTATLQFHQVVPQGLYSFFGGNALRLENGDMEYDLCGETPEDSQTFEVTYGPSPQTVWNLTFKNNYAYRTYRLPSLYPGVQW